eukprot:55919-Chlamydomonas_euryale.AAC.1
MYRGLTVWSGLTPADTRMTWQLCWALGAHAQAAPLPCQVGGCAGANADVGVCSLHWQLCWAHGAHAQ